MYHTGEIAVFTICSKRVPNISIAEKRKKMVLVKRRTKRIKESVKNLLQVQTKVEHHLLE
jgi:hypothetical protein